MKSLNQGILFCGVFLAFVCPYRGFGEAPILLSIPVWSAASSSYIETEEGLRCSFGAFFSFRAEVLDGKIQRALLWADGKILPPKAVPSVTFPFLSAEINGIELYQDPHNRLWLKRLVLSRRLTVWLIQQNVARNNSAIGNRCGPERPVKTLSPEPLVFNFETEIMGVPLGAGVYKSQSNVVSFKGRTIDFVEYEIRWGLIQ